MRIDVLECSGAKLQIAGFDISRSGVSKIEARLSYVDDKTLLYLAEVLKVQLQELFPTRPLAIESTVSSRNLRRLASDAKNFCSTSASVRLYLPC